MHRIDLYHFDLQAKNLRPIGCFDTKKQAFAYARELNEAAYLPRSGSLSAENDQSIYDWLEDGYTIPCELMLASDGGLYVIERLY